MVSRSRRLQLGLSGGIAAFLVGSLVAAPSASRAESIAAPPAHRGWVTGTVVDGNGDPVEGALVNALRPREVPEAGIIAATSPRRTWTDPDGAFRIRQAAPGYLIQICDPEPSDRRVCRETAQGVDFLITYVGPRHTVTDSWVLQTHLFRPASTARRLHTITVKPQSYVHGRIRHARNQVLELRRLNGTTAFRTETDAYGNYRFQGLAPGRYRVAGGGTGSLPWRSRIVHLGRQQDAEVDGVLRKGATIHGVLRSAGKPVPFTDVLVRRSHGRIVAAATTGRRGRYRVAGLRPGSYRVGILYDGSAYQRHGVRVTVPTPTSSLARNVTVRKGAVITISVRQGGHPAQGIRDELRNSAGRPVAGLTADDQGHVRYTGLSAGSYTFVAATDKRYARSRITVTSVKTYHVGRVRLRSPTLTLTGATAPGAVVEALTGDQCPPDGPVRLGAFHFIEKADQNGHYTLDGLVPGRYMLGSDGWPNNYAPRCVSNVPVRHDRSFDLPLKVGGTVSGRLVYARTGTPVITTLSYELIYPKGSPTQPTDEHPSRAKSRGASGRFEIDALGADTVTGRLSQGADLEQINDAEFLVIFPFQDGTPYYLTSGRRTIRVTSGDSLDLGNIPLHLHR
jgi:Carboxypeptidase regulatory-like domain